MNSPYGPELFAHVAGVPNLGIGFAFIEHWGYARWPITFFVQKRPSIALLELCMVVVAIDTLGPFMEGKQICLQSDNEAVVYAINKSSSKCPFCMTLIRHLTLTCMQFQIHLVAVNLVGISNKTVDSLSRFNLSRFQWLRQHYFNLTSCCLNKMRTQISSQ